MQSFSHLFPVNIYIIFFLNFNILNEILKNRMEKPLGPGVSGPVLAATGFKTMSSMHQKQGTGKKKEKISSMPFKLILIPSMLSDFIASLQCHQI
jgi:hypothetical protein